MIRPHHCNGWSVADSLTAGLSAPDWSEPDWPPIEPYDSLGEASGAGGSRNIGRRSRIFAMVTPEMAAHAVAMIEVPTMAEGLVDRLAARIAMAVTGMICTELVLMARKVHMAFVAVPGRGLSVSNAMCT